MKERAREMYIKEQLNCCEISKKIGVSSASILNWVKDVKRSKSEIATIKIIKNGCINWGRKGNIDTVFGNIHYDSGYERDRIKQLTQDENVSFLGRCRDRVKYEDEGKTKCYAPDFYIEYKDGRKIVEEVKPFTYIKKFNNLIKFKSAKNFYKEKQIIFRVATETAIYVGGVRGVAKRKILFNN
jgi:hypothetical protein